MTRSSGTVNKNPIRCNTLFVDLTTETVQGTALALEGVDYIERGDGLALGMLSIGNGITNNTLEECLENTASLLVDHCFVLVSTKLLEIDERGTNWQRYA